MSVYLTGGEDERMENEQKELNKAMDFAVLDNLPSGVAVIETGYRTELKFANQELPAILGYDREDFTARFAANFMMIIHPDDREAFDQMLTECRGRVHARDHVFRFIRKDGLIGWGRFRIRLASRRHTRYQYYCVLSDVTQITKREQKLGKLYDKTKRDCEFLSNLYQNIPCGIIQCTLEKNPRILSVNPKAASIFGFRDERNVIQGTASMLLRLIFFDDRPYFVSQITENLQDQAKAQFECRVVCQDGGTRWISCTGHPVARPDGARVLQLVFFDVTEDKRRDVLLHKQQRELEVTYTKLQIAFEQSEIQMWELDMRTGDLILQEKDAKAYGLPRMLHNFQDDPGDEGFIRPDFIGRHRYMVERLKQGITPVEESLMIGRPDGTFHWARVIYTLVFDENRRPVRAIGIARDQSEEMEALEKYQSEVEYRKNQLKNAVEVAEFDVETGHCIPSDMTVLPDGQNGIGLDFGDYIKHLYLRRLHPDDRKLFTFFDQYDEMVRTLKAGEHGNEISWECRLLSEDGAYAGYHWMNVVMTFMVDLKSRHLHILISMWDIDQEMKERIRLREKALRDPLTRLYNRAAFEEFVDDKLKQELDNTRMQFFILLDIDDFKHVNDTYGHGVGDQAICFVGDTLQSQFRKDDMVARLGGDEFVAYSVGLPSIDHAILKGQRICQSMKGLMVDGRTIPISVSVGIAVAPEHGTVFEALYRNADIALYQAKKMGKNQCLLFQEKWLGLDGSMV